MTIFQAAAISKVNNLPIRRDSWPEDKWFWVWLGGHWFSYSGGKPHTVLATDYTKDDLLADDWTTVPASLANCPITPTEPGGGNPPKPGRGGFADDNRSPPSGYEPSGGGSLSLPPPDLGSSIRVIFSSLNHPLTVPPGHYSIGDLTRTDGWPARSVGAGHWKSEFTTGYIFSGATIIGNITWELEVVLSEGTYTVVLMTNSGAGGISSVPGILGAFLGNTYTDGEINGGFAQVL